MIIVFLVGSYYPYASANGNCAGKLAEEYARRGFKVIVICQKGAANQLPYENLSGCHVFRISTSYNNYFLLLKKHAVRRSFVGKMSKVCLFILRVYNWLRVVGGHHTSDYAWEKSYYDSLCSLGLSNEKAILIPLCHPIEGILAAVNYHRNHHSTILIPWLLDLYADSSTLHRISWNKKIKYKRHIKQEAFILAQSDEVVYLASWRTHLHLLTNGDMSHCHELGLPLATISEETTQFEKSDSSIKELVYLGSLLVKERNPRIALEVMSRYASLHKDFHFKIYHMGNCNKILNDYSTQYPRQIFNCGSVDSSTACKVRASADVLVLIGNAHSVQIPSKTFEYISTRKPILFFVKDENDPIIDLLNQYKNAMIIKESEAQDVDMEALNTFLNNKGRSCGDINSILERNTPSYIADDLINLVKEL